MSLGPDEERQYLAGIGGEWKNPKYSFVWQRGAGDKVGEISTVFLVFLISVPHVTQCTVFVFHLNWDSCFYLILLSRNIPPSGACHCLPGNNPWEDTSFSGAVETSSQVFICVQLRFQCLKHNALEELNFGRIASFPSSFWIFLGIKCHPDFWSRSVVAVFLCPPKWSRLQPASFFHLLMHNHWFHLVCIKFMPAFESMNF